jgi:hypothetical protein
MFYYDSSVFFSSSPPTNCQYFKVDRGDKRSPTVEGKGDRF